MRVRNICSASANQSRLFSRNKSNCFNAFVHFLGEKLSHGAFAGSAIKIASIFEQHVTRATCAGIDSLARALFVNVVANANDHETDVQYMRMIVKCDAIDSQVQVGAFLFGLCVFSRLIGGLARLDPDAPRAYPTL